MDERFREVITTEAQIRAVVGDPTIRAARKQLAALDRHCRAFIAKSPFLLVTTADADGHMDVSPKGDPPGFVRVLDDATLIIPDRLGNRRVDTFKNLLQNRQVGLLFLIPGKTETLRVSGTAMIVRDQWIRDDMAIAGKVPDFVVVVSVEEAFFHCSKCMIRSKLWDSAHWPALDGLPSLAQTVVDAGKLEQSVEEVHALIEQDARERLY